MIESFYGSHTYNMWLAEIVYHIAFRYKEPHASLLKAKAIRQSLAVVQVGGFWTMHRYSAAHSARWQKTGACNLYI